MFKVSERLHHLHLDFFAPTSANALGLEVARELSRIRKDYRKWSRPVIVSSAHARVFCSGGNLSDYKKLKGKEPGLKVNREITKHLDQFAEWSPLKLALIEGDVLGGGMEWLARFDYRWATPYALLAFWQKRIGLSTGWGGGRAWAHKLGEERVRTALCAAQLMSAERARQLGFVDEVVTAWKIRSLAENWAEEMCSRLEPALGHWSVATEKSVFQKLWLGPVHRDVLERWKKV